MQEAQIQAHGPFADLYGETPITLKHQGTTGEAVTICLSSSAKYRWRAPFLGEKARRSTEIDFGFSCVRTCKNDALSEKHTETPLRNVKIDSAIS
jgi:hypothetical protein